MKIVDTILASLNDEEVYNLYLKYEKICYVCKQRFVSLAYETYMFEMTGYIYAEVHQRAVDRHKRQHLASIIKLE